MASVKKPSIYSDRGSIGSAEELDEYGVWVKSEPQVLSSASQGSQKSAGFSMPDFEEPAAGTDDSGDFDSSVFGDDELSENAFDAESDGSLPGLDSLSAEEGFDANFDEFTVSDDDAAEAAFPDSEDDGFPSLDSLSADENPDTNFDDFTVSDDDAADIVPPAEDDSIFEVPTVESIETSGQNKGNDISTQLLLKIANELSSIRVELSELKKEFSVIRTAAPGEEKSEQHEHIGFFSEEDDEKIALTGDELDNILNTADFTEESGANETPDNDSAADDLLAEIPGADEIVLDEISLDDGFAADAPETGISQASLAEGDLSAAAMDIQVAEIDESPVSGEGETGEEEFIHIDVEDLGINLDPEVLLHEKAAAEQEQPLEDFSNIDISLDTSSAKKKSYEIDDLLEISSVEEKLLTGEEFSEDFSPEELSIDDSEIDTLETITEEVGPDTEPAELNLLDETMDSTELNMLRNEGATPITPAPENISYLEESESVEFTDDISLDSTSFDFSEAVIDEPNLTIEGIDDAVAEPSPDEMIDINIDMDSLDDLAIADDGKETEKAEDNEENNFDIDVSMAEDDLDVTMAEDSLDIDMPADDSFDIDVSIAEDDIDIDAPVAEESLDGILADDGMEQVIPEGLEAVIEESPVPFDDDFEGDISVESLSVLDAPAENLDGENTDMDSVPEAAESPLNTARAGFEIPSDLKAELKNVLSYMDQLLESLPEEKIEEFAKSEYFNSYKKLFKDLGLA